MPKKPPTSSKDNDKKKPKKIKKIVKKKIVKKKNIKVKNEKIVKLKKTIKLPKNGKNYFLEKNIIIKRNNSLKEKVETPKEKVETPKEKVETPKEKVETPKENVETPKENVETPKENEKIKEEKIDNKKDIKIISDKLNMVVKTIINDIEKNEKINKDSIKEKLSGFVESLDKNDNLKENQLVKYDPKKNESKKKTLEDLLNDITNSTSNSNPPTIFRFTSTDDFNLSDLFSSKRRDSIFNIPSKPPGLPPPRPPPHIKRKKVNIEVDIENITDLIKLTEEYPLKLDTEYNINMKALHDIKTPLQDLNNMIGMDKLKDSIVDQILYFIQDFHRISNAKSQDFMHTVIYGPPGTGKTEIAKIMGRIFSNMGVLSRKFFKKATRADLIAGYLGQTALKTQDVIKECIGGVLFIDEAYALGNPEKRDSFAKECIDTLCEGLSDHKDNLMVIIAGYEKELKNCFFAYNQGLDSRFTWRFNTDNYNYQQLYLIFKKKVNDIGWKMKENKIKDTWFEDKMDYFKFFGRDIETLLAKVKIAHGRRVFCLPQEKKMILTLKDMNKGFDMFLNNNEVKERKNDRKEILDHMYV